MERQCSIKCDILPCKLTLCRTHKRFYGLFAEKEVLAFSVNLLKKTVKSSMVVRDRDIQDFVLSHTGMVKFKYNRMLNNLLTLLKQLNCKLVTDNTISVVLR